MPNIAEIQEIEGNINRLIVRFGVLIQYRPTAPGQITPRCWQGDNFFCQPSRETNNFKTELLIAFVNLY